MCLVWVLTTRTDQTLPEEGSERSTKGDSETAPFVAMSRIPCPKKNGRKNGRHLWEVLKACERWGRKGIEGHRNVGTEHWHGWLGCCNCTWGSKSTGKVYGRKVAQGYKIHSHFRLKICEWTDSEREGKWTRKRALCAVLTPPGEAAGGDCQEQDTVLRWLPSVTLCDHGSFIPLLRNSLSIILCFYNIVCQVVPRFLWILSLTVAISGCQRRTCWQHSMYCAPGQLSQPSWANGGGVVFDSSFNDFFFPISHI